MAIDPQKYNTFFQGLTLDQRQGAIRDKLSADAVMAKYGSQPTQPTAQPATMTSTQTTKPSSYEDQGKALIQSQFDQTQKDATDLGLGPTFTSIDQQFQESIKRQREQKAQQEQQLKLQQQNNTDQAIQASNIANANTATQQGQLTGSREGMFSATNQMGVNKLGTALKEQTDRILQAQSSAQAEVQKAQNDLAYAEQTNNTQLAQQYRQTLNQATLKAKQIDTEYMQTLQQGQGQALDIVKSLQAGGALSGLSQEDITSLEQSLPNAPPGVIKALSAAATKASMSNQQAAEFEQQTKGLESMTKMFANGAKMGIEDVTALSENLGVPLDLAIGAYNSFAAIRDDKNLSAEEKIQKMQDANYDLQQKARGIFTKEAQNVDYIKNLRKNGDIEAAQAMERALGIDDLSYQAEINYKNAQTQYQQSQTAENYQNLKKSQLEYINMSGQSAGAFVPTNSLEGIQSSYQDGKLNIQCNTPYQCGAFVNRFWGISSDGSGGMADSAASKENLVATRGVSVKQINQNNFFGTIKAGMAFVTKYGGTDHTGIVTAVYPDGSYDTMEANVGDKNPNTPDPPLPRHRTIKDADLVGFVYPPGGKAELQGQGAKSTNSNDPAQIAQNIMQGNLGLDLDSIKQELRPAVANELAKFKNQALKSNDTIGFIKASAGGKQLSDTATATLGKAQNVLNQIGDLNTTINSMDTGPVTNLFRSANPYDVDKTKLKAQLQAIVPNLARGIYGEVGVLTDNDIDNYIQTLPNGASTEDQKKALMDFTLNIVNKSIKTSLKNYAMSGYNVSGYAPLLKEIDSQTGGGDSTQPSTFTELLDKNTPADYSQHANFNRY